LVSVSEGMPEAEERNDPNYDDVLRKIVSMLNEIDFTTLGPSFRKCLSYIATVAFSEINPEMETAFIKKHFSLATLTGFRERRNRSRQRARVQ